LKATPIRRLHPDNTDKIYLSHPREKSGSSGSLKKMPNHAKKYSLSLMIFFIVFLVVAVNFFLILANNLWVTILGAILFLLVIFLFWRTVAYPLTELIAACRKVKAGDLNAKVKIKSKTEIGELISTFNEMLDEEKKYKANLEEAKDVLEVKVDARTKELQELIDNQEKTIAERTKELEERVKELERFYKLTVGRELKMIELKKEIKRLDQKGVSPRGATKEDAP